LKGHRITKYLYAAPNSSFRGKNPIYQNASVS